MRIASIKLTKGNQAATRIIFPAIRMKVTPGLGLSIALKSHPAISPIALPSLRLLNALD
jgi:hypothetical protein